MNFDEKYSLNRGNIDLLSEKVTETCHNAKISEKDAILIRLGIEESLLSWLARFGEDQEIHLLFHKTLFWKSLTIRCKNEVAYNPYTEKEDSESLFTQSIHGYLRVIPTYYYSNGWNSLTFHLKKPARNPLLSLLAVILCAIMIGVMGKLLLPQRILELLNSGFLAPTYEKFLDILGCIAGPLIFLSASWGIYGMGDTATLNRLGKGLISTTMKSVFLAALLCVPAAGIFHCRLAGNGADLTQLASIYQMFLNILPLNIVAPFYEGNILQIIVLAVIVGMCLLYLEARTKKIAVFIGQLNTMVSFLMELIGRIVPYFIATALINLIWSGEIAVFRTSWQFVLVLVCWFIGAMAVTTLFTACKQRVSPATLVRKVFPAYLVALTTASSAAAFGTMTKNCENELGIRNQLTSFGIPLGIILQKTASTINNMMVIFYISSIVQVDLSVSKIVLMVFVSAITAIATPPVPGGAAIAYTALFTQIGLPMECLPMVLAIDMVTDFLITSTDIYCMQLMLVNLASHYDLLDREVLLR